MTQPPVDPSTALPGPAELSGLLTLHDIEREGQARLTPNALGYYRSGANDERTLRANAEDFARLRLRPRVLNDVSHVQLRTEVLGLPLDAPIAVAPTAFHGLAHPDAEQATARAAASAGSLMTLSTLANTGIEAVAAAQREAAQEEGAGDPAASRLWFQLYLYKDRGASRELIARAEAAGARALVLTVDTPELGRREVNERHGFSLPPHLEAPHLGPRGQLRLLESGSGSQLTRYFMGLIDPGLSWRDVAWLREVTKLPIVLKGILTPEDAVLAVQHGAAGVWVSNHGGRQLDSAVSGIAALPEVVQAVRGRAEVYLDGGVRRGTDVLKALALGARAVFLGRPILYGLACGGEAGVRHTLALLREELRLALALSGQTDVRTLWPGLVRAQ